MKSRKFFAFLILPLLLGCQPVKTKSLLDQAYELDPQGKIFVSPILVRNPPKSVAVLPFRSLAGGGRIVGSRGFFNLLNRGEGMDGGVVAERMRRAFFGQFSQLEFDHIKLSRVDRILQKEELHSWEKFRFLPARRLGELLQADALVFGEVTHFDYYYAFLYAQLAVGLSMEMVDSETGATLWRVKDARRDHTMRVVYEPISLVVGLFQVGFALRPISMMRAMDEICRELAGTIPPPPPDFP